MARWRLPHPGEPMPEWLRAWILAKDMDDFLRICSTYNIEEMDIDEWVAIHDLHGWQDGLISLAKSNYVNATMVRFVMDWLEHG